MILEDRAKYAKTIPRRYSVSVAVAWSKGVEADGNRICLIIPAHTTEPVRWAPKIDGTPDAGILIAPDTPPLVLTLEANGSLVTAEWWSSAEANPVSVACFGTLAVH